MGKRIQPKFPHLFVLVFLASLLCWILPLQALPKARNPIRFVTLDHVKYLYLDDIANFYGMNYTKQGKSAILSSKYSRLVFELDKRQATLNTVNQHLGFAIRTHNQHLSISYLDFVKILDPILRPATIPRHQVRKIVIDAGHGGKDPGCNGAAVYEKNVNLQVALKLARLLKQRGYEVAMTRQSDAYFTLQQRVDGTNKYKPDLFISLHCNAVDAKDVNGIEVYCATAAGTPPSDSKTISPNACPANTFDLENAYLAFQAQRRLCSFVKTTDRGAKHKRYTVIEKITCPGILVEMGFLTNAAECQALASSSRQNSIAMALANAVDEYRMAVAPKMMRKAR